MCIYGFRINLDSLAIWDTRSGSLSYLVLLLYSDLLWCIKRGKKRVKDAFFVLDEFTMKVSYLLFVVGLCTRCTEHTAQECYFCILCVSPGGHSNPLSVIVVPLRGMRVTISKLACVEAWILGFHRVAGLTPKVICRFTLEDLRQVWELWD